MKAPFSVQNGTRELLERMVNCERTAFLLNGVEWEMISVKPSLMGPVTRVLVETRQPG